MISAFVAFILPDVPQRVKDEIRRKKILAQEAIHMHHEEGKRPGLKKADENV